MRDDVLRNIVFLTGCCKQKSFSGQERRFYEDLLLAILFSGQERLVRDRLRERERERERERKRERDTETDRQTDREREIGSLVMKRLSINFVKHSGFMQSLYSLGQFLTLLIITCKDKIVNKLCKALWLHAEPVVFGTVSYPVDHHL